MPFGDGTGPMGFGSMTGRAAGYCAGYPSPGYANPAPGFGFGRGFSRGMGRGFGRGFGRRFWRFGFQPAYPAATARTVPVRYEPEYVKEDEVADLKTEKEAIERELKDIDERIRELEKK